MRDVDRVLGEDLVFVSDDTEIYHMPKLLLWHYLASTNVQASSHWPCWI